VADGGGGREGGEGGGRCDLRLAALRLAFARCNNKQPGPPTTNEVRCCFGIYNLVPEAEELQKRQRGQWLSLLPIWFPNVPAYLVPIACDAYGQSPRVLPGLPALSAPELMGTGRCGGSGMCSVLYGPFKGRGLPALCMNCCCLFGLLRPSVQSTH
jgi:hypothetical protein